MVLPVLLRQLGYTDIPVVQLIEGLSFKLQDNAFYSQMPWCGLRDLFEYIACVEHSLQRVRDLPTESALLGSQHETAARYDSAAAVLFAQAALDNLAVWVNDYYSLGLRNNNISFYKNKMPAALAQKEGIYAGVFKRNGDFIKRLNDYRMAWLHRVSGGASFMAEEDPAMAKIMVPIAPIDFSLSTDPLKYIAEVEKIKAENNGVWLMPVSQFVEWVKDGMLAVVLEVLTVVTEKRE